MYASQGWAGDLASRPVHLAYVALANALAPIAQEALPRWLDAVSSLAAGVVVLAAGRTWVAAAIAAAVVLPWCPFAEVDLPWIALVALAVHATPAVASVLVALAVAVSPVALLALPWLVATRGEARALAGAVVAVVVLTGVSGGAWWIGDRGVLTAGVFLPGRVAEAWLVGIPWLGLLFYRGAPGPLLACLPLLLAPPDVPTAIVPGLAIAGGVRGGPGAVGLRLAIALQVLLSGAQLGRLVGRVDRDDALFREVVAQLGPADGLVARWSDGARVGVLATGDPYGPVWRPIERPVRDQAERWCAALPERVAVLDGGRVRWEPGGPWHVRFGCPRDTSAP